MTAPVRTARSRTRAAALGLAGGVLLAWELLFRLVPPPDPTVPTGTPAAGTITLEGDPWLLWQLRPGDREEHGKRVHVNRLGFRDRDRGRKSGPRILTLGDSSVYGFGVADEEVFSARLELDLADGGPGIEVPGIEVIDGATPGWSTFQTLNMLEMRGWAFEPDLLVIGNLWSDNNFDDFVDRELLASYNGFEQSLGYAARGVLSHSALFRWLDWQLRVGPRQEQARKVGWSMGGEGPKSGKRRVSINDYADNLDTLCARARQRGAGVLFLMLANREDVGPASRPGRSPDPAWGPYREVMRDAAARHGVPVVDVPEIVAASGRGEDALFLDQMHPTADGHTLIAGGVKAAIEAAGWPGNPLVPTRPAPRVRLFDPFEGRGVDPLAPAHNVRVQVPDYTGGDLILMVESVQGAPLQSVRLSRPDVAPIEITARQVMFRLVFDRDHNGQSANDEQRVLGPVEVGVGETALSFGPETGVAQ